MYNHHPVEPIGFLDFFKKGIKTSTMSRWTTFQQSTRSIFDDIFEMLPLIYLLTVGRIGSVAFYPNRMIGG